ncbi:MAG TPA: hypothetical protein VGA96_03545 [Fibrella sp.]|jgi:hypothetical protein
MNLRLKSFLLNVCFMVCLTACFAQPASAGYWKVTYKLEGLSTSKWVYDELLYPGVEEQIIQEEWSLEDERSSGLGHVEIPFVNFGPHQYYKNIQESNGSATVVMTWTPDNEQDSSLPPKSVPVLLTFYGEVSFNHYVYYYDANGTLINYEDYDLRAEESISIYDGMGGQYLNSGNTGVVKKHTGKLVTIENPYRKQTVSLAHDFGLRYEGLWESDPLPVGATSALQGVHKNPILYFEAKPVSFSYGVRRHDSTMPNASFSGVAQIAAGGKPSDEHKADVAASIVPLRSVDQEYYEPSQYAASRRFLSGHELPVPRIVYGDGVEGGAKATFSGQNNQTNASGWAIIGKITSSNRTTPSVVNSTSDGLITLKLPVEMGDDNPKAHIEQVWAYIEWRMGQYGEKEFDPEFFAGESDVTELIWVKPTTVAGKPLEDHVFRYIAELLIVNINETATQPAVTKIFTTDPDEAAKYANDPTIQVEYREDIGPLVSEYISLPTTLTAASPGVYNGPVTIKHGEDFVVESYQLALEDQGTYIRKPEVQ